MDVLSVEYKDGNPKLGKIIINGFMRNVDGFVKLKAAYKTEGFDVDVPSFDGNKVKGSFLATKGEEMYWVSYKGVFPDRDSERPHVIPAPCYYEINIE